MTSSDLLVTSSDFMVSCGPVTVSSDRCVPPAVRVQSQERLLGKVAPALRQAQQQKESPGWRPGGFFESSAGRRLQVEAAGLRIREEGCERSLAHDMRARLGALAVADRDHFVEVGGHLHASAVVLAQAGLPPYCARQVCHGSTPSVG